MSLLPLTPPNKHGSDTTHLFAWKVKAMRGWKEPLNCCHTLANVLPQSLSPHSKTSLLMAVEVVSYKELFKCKLSIYFLTGIMVC